MGRLFGTDGVRGVAGVDLTPELAMGLAVAAAQVLGAAGGSPAGERPVASAAERPVAPAGERPIAPAAERPIAIVGRDPRPSGELLEAAVVAGLLSSGVDVVRLGLAPTAAVAHAMTSTPPGGRLPALGVMISASHNPMPDNGLKFFGPGGGKLPDDVEDAIEAALGRPGTRAQGAEVGRVREDPSSDLAAYVDHLVRSLPHRLDGLRIVVDCANGAAGEVAPAAYRDAGAEVLVINDDLSGYRINEGCGATHLEPLRAAVQAYGAAAGLAHDGDADRCLAVDADGRTVDGDQILAILAVALKERGALRGDAVAATVMSNLGFHRAMAAHGIRVAETSVGDRYVVERMRAEGLALGGEQSGHIVLADHAVTGDGILTGLHLLARVAQTRRSLADLARVVERLPQVLVNVTVPDKTAALAALDPLVEQARAELGEAGRILVRPSGTEPLVRVMVEAASEGQARQIAQSLAGALGTPAG